MRSAMRKAGVIAGLGAGLALGMAAAAAAQQSPPVERSTDQAHAEMMARLGIDELRPGANPNDPDAPNAVNYDEAQANPYPDWPDPLVTVDGLPVDNARMWRQVRRPQIVEAFDREVYGRVPEDVPAVTWEAVEQSAADAGGVPVRVTKLAGRVDNSDYPAIDVTIDLTVARPADAEGDVPVIVEFGFGGFPGRPAPAFPPEHARQILERGWAYASLVPTSVQADDGAGLTEGIIGLTNHGQPRRPDQWGALRAWAWGVSRAMDYFETAEGLDADRVAIAGLSRYGKAAAVAMAYEPRLAVGFIGSSGKGGLAPHRRNLGELVENVAGAGEHHWMAGNYLKYAGPLSWDDLPVDAHHLIALAAPRPYFISAGAPDVEGQWVDQRGMFMAAKAASPVYELLGAEGLGDADYPAVQEGLTGGDLAFRVHEGGHTLGPNWPYMLDFAARYWED